MADSFIGHDLGGYRITRLLKRTGMSMIYLAWDAKLQREVVVKIMLPHGEDDSFAARFQQEALATARLAHPNIVHIYDFGQREDLSYMVMEYLPGGSLHDRLTAAAGEGKRLDPGQSAAIVRQVALALEHAHRVGIIHRDVKPSNILFAHDGRPVLTDLGIARAHEGPRLTKTLTAVGTPEYMSPEQGRGEPVDGRSDIYSLGVVLYELLAGVLPFQADTVWGLIFKHIQEPPPPIEAMNPAVPLAMRSVVEKALAKRPEDRFQTAREMADAIQRALEMPTRRLYATPTSLTPPGRRNTPAPRVTPPQRAPSWPRPAPDAISDAKTRLLTGEPATAATGTGSSVRPSRRTRPQWFLAGGAALLTLTVMLVFGVALRPSSQEAAPSPAAVAQVVGITATPLDLIAEPIDTPQPDARQQVSTAISEETSPTAMPSPTFTQTVVPPTATATRPAPTATRVPPTATAIPPTATPVPPTATPRPPTATRLPPTATPRPPTATSLPPTRTRAPATATRLSPPQPSATARLTGVLPAPALLDPADNASLAGQATFAWRWDGPALAANQAFELRIWKEGQPDHYGAAEPTRDTSITINLGAAYGVAQGGAGQYYWTVAVVERDPYGRVGPEAAPRRLQFGSSGGESGPPPPPIVPKPDE